MASVHKRERLDGSVVYRLRFRFKGYADFSLTFDDYDVACVWARENESEYVKDSERFCQWKEDLYWDMWINGEMVRDHMVRSKFKVRSRFQDFVDA